MNERERQTLLGQLVDDEEARDRDQYDYTVDALIEGGITPLSIWPQSNQGVQDIINGKIDYDAPLDDGDKQLNEFHKGGLFTEQQDIILRNNGKQPLCEAQDLEPCSKEKCILHHSSLGPPVCGEFKMVFKK